MSRYIDADAFLKEYCAPYPHVFMAMSKAMAEAPSIDIVRCKECRYKRINEDGETRYYYCALEDRPNRQWSVDDTDFCSWGEREGE